MTRTELISELANDIVDNIKHAPISRYDCIDYLLDAGDIDTRIVFGLADDDDTKVWDAKRDMDDMIRKFAIDYLTTDPKGQLFIDDKLADDERDRAADAEWERSAA